MTTEPPEGAGPFIPLISDFMDTPEPAGALTATPAPVLNREAVTNPAAEQARQAAFDSEFLWEGRRLEPFSITRYNVFLAQRVAVGSPPMWRVLDDWNAFYPDAVRIIWLCSTPPKIVALLRCEPLEMQEAVDAWAEKHAPISQRRELSAVAIKIWNASQENQHLPAPLENAGHGDDLGN